ncbi:response regulator [Janthinobacterium lividum]|jgi:CheY-like chemotaxis protein|uniref:Response regulator n=1 Tax=Janthinobacterium lividum TaxID=29581 RepID=A0AAJ4MR11_9BURK|nr:MULTISPECIES: response regulator [Janthinobacterium]KAB0326387.1 response regulator [Janthinobacterium lividum]KHA76092.1 chemotaxis protein [Janthinobacterium lividum]MBR7631752.1 response regulator [Janthinobacterium lividum]MCC7695955.1 response regulator [Janthinobacterium sp. EB271-G4-7A]MDO8034694.1 response regulator [Janthinobacterium sp. SUN128]
MNHSKQVLVVDDSRVSRLMSHQFILSKHADWQVIEAATGEEALEKVKTVNPVLILLDVNMPGMGGMAAAEQLRVLCPQTHIILVTANVQNATRNRASELGVGFMEKPITETRIHQLIESLGL